MTQILSNLTFMELKILFIVTFLYGLSTPCSAYFQYVESSRKIKYIFCIYIYLDIFIPEELPIEA